MRYKRQKKSSKAKCEENFCASHKFYVQSTEIKRAIRWPALRKILRRCFFTIRQYKMMKRVKWSIQCLNLYPSLAGLLMNSMSTIKYSASKWIWHPRFSFRLTVKPTMKTSASGIRTKDCQETFSKTVRLAMKQLNTEECTMKVQLATSTVYYRHCILLANSVVLSTVYSRTSLISFATCSVSSTICRSGGKTCEPTSFWKLLDTRTHNWRSSRMRASSSSISIAYLRSSWRAPRKSESTRIFSMAKKSPFSSAQISTMKASRRSRSRCCSSIFRSLWLLKRPWRVCSRHLSSQVRTRTTMKSMASRQPRNSSGFANCLQSFKSTSIGLEWALPAKWWKSTALANSLTASTSTK